MGRAGPLIDIIGVNPTLIDVDPTFKYLETKKRAKLLVKQASSNGHVNMCINLYVIVYVF